MKDYDKKKFVLDKNDISFTLIKTVQAVAHNASFALINNHLANELLIENYITGEKMASFKYQKKLYVQNACFSPSGNLVCVDYSTFKAIKDFQLPLVSWPTKKATLCHFLTESCLIALEDTLLMTYALDTKTLSTVMQLSSEPIYQLIPFPKQHMVALVFSDRVNIIDLNKKVVIKKLVPMCWQYLVTRDNKKNLTIDGTCKLAPTKQLVLYRNKIDNNKLWIMDWDHKIRASINHPAPVISYIFSSNERYAATTTGFPQNGNQVLEDMETLRVFDIDALVCLFKIKFFDWKISVESLSDNNFLVNGLRCMNYIESKLFFFKSMEKFNRLYGYHNDNTNKEHFP